MYRNFGLIGLVLLSLIYGALLRQTYLFFWRHYPSAFATVFYVLFITSFHFSSDRLVNFEQQVFLLFVCYAAATFLTNAVQPALPVLHRAPGQPSGSLADPGP
jgi:hypothetical protein